MKTCEEEYEFNRKEADKEFNKLIKFKDLDKEAKEILGDENEEAENIKEQDYDGKRETNDREKGIMEERSDEDDGNLFGGLLDNIPEGSVISGASHSSLIIREMPLSKTFTGRLPKDYLQEFCRKIDDQVKISFVRDQASSGENLHKYFLRVQWSNEKNNGKEKEWNMGNVACRTKPEAMNYVATLALFELTDLPLYMSFPSCFKDLWLELKNEKISAQNKTKLAEQEERIKFLIEVTEEKKKKENVSYKIINIFLKQIDLFIFFLFIYIV